MPTSEARFIFMHEINQLDIDSFCHAIVKFIFIILVITLPVEIVLVSAPYTQLIKHARFRQSRQCKQPPTFFPSCPEICVILTRISDRNLNSILNLSLTHKHYTIYKYTRIYKK